MKVLFVCSQGTSSAIAVKALREEATKNNVSMDIISVGTYGVEEEVKKGCDVIMIAPQERHRFEFFRKHAEIAGAKCVLIEPQAYCPLGGEKVFKQITNAIYA